MEKFNDIYVGLDVHKETIAVAVVRGLRQQPQYFGEITNTQGEIKKLVKKLSPHGEVMNFCYEAGPCGYELYRQLGALGQQCDVVAPSLIPRKAGERIKTDRRDALMLARLHSCGELTAVWVPDVQQEGKVPGATVAIGRCRRYQFVVRGCQWVGSSSAIRLLGCVGRRSNTSVR